MRSFAIVISTEQFCVLKGNTTNRSDSDASQLLHHSWSVLISLIRRRIERLSLLGPAGEWGDGQQGLETVAEDGKQGEEEGVDADHHGTEDGQVEQVAAVHDDDDRPVKEGCG